MLPRRSIAPPRIRAPPGRSPDGAEAEGPESLVRRLRLERDGFLTNASALLFSPEPDAYIPGCTVKIGFFEGPEVVYQDEVRGPLIRQVDEAVELLYRLYLRAKISYEGIYRVERYPFPRAAVREAVTNSVCHKNYAMGAPVQIRVYDDRLVVCNSCILPEGWGVESLLEPHPSEPHNPKVANAFFLAGLVESWGRGVQKILLECKLDGIDPPEYRLVGNTLSVTFAAPEDRVVRTGGRLEGTGTDSEDFGEAGKGGPAEATETREPMDSMESDESWPELAGIGRNLGKPLGGRAEHSVLSGRTRILSPFRHFARPARARKVVSQGGEETRGFRHCLVQRAEPQPPICPEAAQEETWS